MGRAESIIGNVVARIIGRIFWNKEIAYSLTLTG